MALTEILLVLNARALIKDRSVKKIKATICELTVTLSNKHVTTTLRPLTCC